ncbi:MAG: NBR1-Ig-like domain-containing protein [Anaerolineales bacterium]|nr:MAG: NBR1-Ig-like domain-containing protein [Anaerolineales bacterium]
MKTTRFFLIPIPSIKLRAGLLLLPILFYTAACAPRSTPAPFRPPTQPPPTQPPATTTPVPALFTAAPAPSLIPTPTTGPCTNGLSFVDDITIQDGSSFFAGASIDKQWLVQNSGTCNWDASYRLKWVGGSPLGAAEEQPLFPARAGTQATIRIVFTAPAETGTYESAWQALDPDGNVFGDLIFMQIVVSP